MTASFFMEEKVARKTTAKKTVRRTTTKVAPRRTAARKTAEISLRKAPARVSVSPAFQKRSKTPLIVTTVLVVVIGASVGIGYSDKGTIDVSSVITERKQNATPEEHELFKTIPVQQSQNNVINGGLVGAGKPPSLVPAKQPEIASTSHETATTTEDTAPAEEKEVSVEAKKAQSEDTSHEEPMAI
jgi:hypothetical protein